MDTNDEIIEKFNQIIINSNKIEKLFSELSINEYKYGIKSNEYKMITKIIESSTSLEKELLDEIINNDLCLAFKEYIEYDKSDRLIHIIDNNFNYSKEIIEALQEESYEQEKSMTNDFISKEEYMIIQYNEFGKHALRQKIFNLIESKMYIKTIDKNIHKEKDLEIKKYLIDEKNNTLCNNSSLQEWYFSYNTDLMLIESDYLCALEFGIMLDEYRRLKINYFENNIENELELLELEDFDTKYEKKISEINILTALKCLNPEKNSKYNRLSSNKIKELKINYKNRGVF